MKHRVIVKFQDYFTEEILPYIDEIEEYLEKNEIGEWSKLERMFPGITMSRYFKILDKESHSRIISRVKKVSPNFRPKNFLTYFVVEYPEGDNPAALAKEILKWESVEDAYVEHKPAPPPSGATDIVKIQDYLEPAPAGVNAKHGWAITPGNGLNIKLVDMERGWNLNHESLPQGISLISSGGINHDYMGHGTAVLGTINFQDAGVHCSCINGGIKSDCKCLGMAKDSVLHVVSEVRSVDSAGNPVLNKAEAILAVLSAQDSNNNDLFLPGDILLLESQSNLENTDPDDSSVFTPQIGYAPIEVYNAEYNAINTGTAAGITVIEASCNAIKNGGSYNSPVDLNSLEKIINGSGKKILFRNKNNNDYRDSGAIMVGAATWDSPHKLTVDPPPQTSELNLAGSPVPDAPGPPSNFGNRVDCYAWGEYVRTTGDGDMGTANNDYTILFSGSSSASAIIAGVALIVQGVAKANGLGGSSNGTFTPKELREILGSFDPDTNQPWRRTGTQADPPFGTKSNDPAIDLIGVMPDLKKIFTSSTAVNVDVYMRDNINDTGGMSMSSSGPISASPDIFVKDVQSSQPDQDFGDNSGQENASNLSVDPIEKNGTDKYIYVRVKNRGTAPAAGITVTVKYSPPSTLPSPGSWIEIGSTNSFVVPGGDKMRVAEIEWASADIPSDGHYCFIGTVESYTDPPPNINAITNINDFITLVKDNNNVVWKNFNVVTINSPGVIARAGGSENAHVEFREPDEDEIVMHFFVTGAEFEDAEMRLEIGGDLPDEADISFEAPQNLLENMFGDDLVLEGSDEKQESIRTNRTPLGNLQTASKGIRPFVFSKDLREPAALIVHLPEELRTKPYEIFIRQLHEGDEVGRITWQLVPHKEE